MYRKRRVSWFLEGVVEVKVFSRCGFGKKGGKVLGISKFRGLRGEEKRGRW